MSEENKNRILELFKIIEDEFENMAKILTRLEEGEKKFITVKKG